MNRTGRIFRGAVRALARRLIAPVPADEQRIDLSPFWHDGAVRVFPGRGRNLPDLCLGRTDSKRGLGFEFTHGEQVVRFVLDREQVKVLREYLDYQARRIQKETN